MFNSDILFVDCSLVESVLFIWRVNYATSTVLQEFASGVGEVYILVPTSS